ncbi:MAG: M3 family oligoendopeptidase [Deltaproteobacteria bacterium]|nr:M3 family oligoendopeptidase [Deltaproteobacteria bacterium]
MEERPLFPDGGKAEGARWDLSDLYRGPDDPVLETDLEASLAEAEGFQKAHQGEDLATLEADRLLSLLREYEALQERGLKPLLYASLLFAEDTQNAQHQVLMQRARERWSDLESRLLFFRLALIALPPERLSALLAHPGFEGYRHALPHFSRFREFTRPQKEEEILNRKNLSGRAALTTLFDEFTGSFTYPLRVGGEEKELTGSEVLALLHSPNRELRQRAFRTFLSHHERNGLVLTSLFNALFLDDRVEDEIRGLPYPMYRTHLENEIRPEIVELMMEATENHYSLAREYFALKARRLGLPRLENSDLYAPLGAEERKIDFAQARELLLSTFQRFHPRFGEIAGEFFRRRWVDAEVRRGKYGGAFCSGLTPALHPYLLLNFTGHLRDVLTLAHEMGHAIHFHLARRQSLLQFDPPLPLAETASVLGEMVLVQALLREEKDPATRIALLAAEIEDMIATVFRQNVLTRFEQEAREARSRRPLTSAELGDLWWQANARLFGDRVEMVPEYRWGWSYISHFIHSRFYCYSYVFGELVALALYERWGEEGDHFLPRLIRLLEAGGAGSPEGLLRAAGVDIGRADFWEKGFRVFRGLLEEFKAAVEEKS